MYFFGLIILSIAAGHRWDQVTGWMVLGTGIILFTVFDALLRHIRIRKS